MNKAEKILLVIKGYLDATARKHNCVGFDCRTCALNGDRFLEALDLVKTELASE